MSEGVCGVPLKEATRGRFCFLPLQLLPHMRGSHRIFRKDENQDPRFIDRPDDAVGIESPGNHIPRRDPALKPMLLKTLDNRIRDCRILRCIADEYRPEGFGNRRPKRLSYRLRGVFHPLIRSHTVLPTAAMAVSRKLRREARYSRLPGN